MVQEIPLGKKTFLRGNLNGHVGSECRGCGVCTGYGLGESNAGGKAILDFSVAFCFTVAKLVLGSGEHLITYKSRAFSSQIDFLFIRKLDRKLCMNCKVFLGESLTTRHKVLVMYASVKLRIRIKCQDKVQRIKW